MRQAGILAAAGIYALENMVDRLVEDHRRAKMLAYGLNSIDGINVEIENPPSNMVFVTLDKRIVLPTPVFHEKLKNLGVKVGVSGSKRFRMVTHYWVDDKGIEQTINAFQRVMSEIL